MTSITPIIRFQDLDTDHKERVLDALEKGLRAHASALDAHFGFHGKDACQPHTNGQNCPAMRKAARVVVNRRNYIVGEALFLDTPESRGKVS